MGIGFLYSPDNVGKTILSKRNKFMTARKYHLTDVEIENCICRHIENTKNVPDSIKNICSPYFFNPYRRGIYWCQIQSLYLLGCNRWHDFRSVLNKTKELMSTIKIIDYKTKTSQDLWSKFKHKYPDRGVLKSKDFIGRIQENFIFMQRLGCNHPAGYKLRQAHSALDIKKVSKRGFSNGLYYYRLSTYSNEVESYPIRDFSEYSIHSTDYRHFKKNFVGVIIVNEV